jgi:multisubunit Na+/H+ antiporter MnhE subunit
MYWVWMALQNFGKSMRFLIYAVMQQSVAHEGRQVGLIEGFVQRLCSLRLLGERSREMWLRRWAWRILFMLLWVDIIGSAE